MRLRKVDDTPANDEFENIVPEESSPEPEGPNRRPIILGIAAFAGGVILLVLCLVIYSFVRSRTGSASTSTPAATATQASTAVDTQPAGETPITQPTLAIFTDTPAPTPIPVRAAALSELVGQVQVRPDPNSPWSAAVEGQVLSTGSTVLTGQDSRAKITLPEGNLIRISSQTQFTLLEVGGTDTDPVDRAQLDFGKVWAIVLSPLNSGVFEIQLPIGLAAVRGSYLSAEYNSTTNGTVVSCLEGTCHYENANGAVDFLTGQQAVSRNGGAPTLELISPNQLNDWNPQNIPEVVSLTPPPSETLPPSETPVATETPIATPTKTLVPSRTPLPSFTPRPTRTPTLTRTPRPTRTATNTPTETDTPGPTATFGAPAKLVFTMQPPNSVRGNQAFQLQVAIQDASGATILTATDAVSLSIGTNGGGGALAGATTVGPINGVATFNVSIDKGGQYTLVASAPNLPTTLSAVFNVETSNAQFFIITGLSNDVSSGQPVTITVNAIQDDGTVSQDYLGTIHFSSSDGQAGLPADYTFTANDRGSHAFSIIFRTTGSQTLKAVDVQTPSLAGYAGVDVK